MQTIFLVLFLVQWAGLGAIRIAVWLILNCSESKFFAVFATVCSSWVQMNAFTSKRSHLLPEGDVGKANIKEANQMVSRKLVCNLAHRNTLKSTDHVVSSSPVI